MESIIHAQSRRGDGLEAPGCVTRCITRARADAQSSAGRVRLSLDVGAAGDRQAVHYTLTADQARELSLQLAKAASIMQTGSLLSRFDHRR